MLVLITSSVIDEYLVVLEQAFNPSNVVVAVSGLDAMTEARGILVSLACCARPSQGLPGVCWVFRLTAQTMGLERLRRKHQGPEWVD